jgi:DNA repair protein RecN (Recombination protein N)
VLKRLSIRDFGIIDQVAWVPSPGLNVLTGETGAGKSLVLDALDVLAGRRAGQEVVRTGAEASSIEAEVARFGGGEASSLVGLLVIRREVERSGRGTATVDGRVVPVRALREVAAQLFDLHGPNQQFALLDAARRLYGVRFGAHGVYVARRAAA